MIDWTWRTSRNFRHRRRMRWLHGQHCKTTGDCFAASGKLSIIIIFTDYQCHVYCRVVVAKGTWRLWRSVLQSPKPGLIAPNAKQEPTVALGVPVLRKNGRAPLAAGETSLCHRESFARERRMPPTLDLEIRVGAEKCAYPYRSHMVVPIVFLSS